MSSVVVCPTCGSGNAPQIARCWVCGRDLGDAVAPSEPAQASASAQASPSLPTHDPNTRTFQVLGWGALLLGIAFTAILIAVELALEWPGMLIPYAVVVLVAFVALGRTAFMQLQKKPDAATGPARPGALTGTDVVQGVALGLAIAMAVIAGLMLLAVAAVVIFFLICLALVSQTGFH